MTRKALVQRIDQLEDNETILVPTLDLVAAQTGKYEVSDNEMGYPENLTAIVRRKTPPDTITNIKRMLDSAGNPTFYRQVENGQWAEIVMKGPTKEPFLRTVVEDKAFIQKLLQSPPALFDLIDFDDFEEDLLIQRIEAAPGIERFNKIASTVERMGVSELIEWFNDEDIELLTVGFGKEIFDEQSEEEDPDEEEDNDEEEEPEDFNKAHFDSFKSENPQDWQRIKSYIIQKMLEARE